MTALVAARIVTPGDWADLDLDPSTRHGSIVRAVRQAVSRDPRLAGHQVRLLGLLDDVARRAYDSGAFFCSSLVLSSDGDTSRASAGADLLAANLLMQVAPMPASDGPPPGGFDACAGLAAAISCDPDWEDADVTVVTMPAGPVVRVEIVAGGVCLQYLVPVRDSSSYVILTFTSPCPPYVSALLRLFDSMAESLVLEYETVSGAID